jgi:hypothetical protein
MPEALSWAMFCLVSLGIWISTSGGPVSYHVLYCRVACHRLPSRFGGVGSSISKADSCFPVCLDYAMAQLNFLLLATNMTM